MVTAGYGRQLISLPVNDTPAHHKSRSAVMIDVGVVENYVPFGDTRQTPTSVKIRVIISYLMRITSPGHQPHLLRKRLFTEFGNSFFITLSTIVRLSRD